MFYGRLQSKLATLAIPVFLLMVGVVGLAAAAGQGGQAPAGAPSSANRANPPASNPAPRVVGNSSTAGMPVKSTAKAVGAVPLKTITPTTPSAARGRAQQTPGGRPLAANKVKVQSPVLPPKVIHNSPLVKKSGVSSREAGAVGAQFQKTTMPSDASVAAGRRDPFKPWVALSTANHSASEAGTLPPGTRGLVVSGLRLEGIVRQEPGNAMIAVVTNYTKRAYFLRVSDAVYNGVVSKITPEAIYFKENTLDSRGRVATHEVELKLGSAPGEGR